MTDHEGTTVLAILGWPVSHSRSPAMHAAAIETLGLNAVYVPFAVAPTDLEAAVNGLRALGVRGFNVTLPHKQAMVALVDEVSPEARAIGAVNTVVRTKSGWRGENTDAEGLARALEEAGVRLEGIRVAVIGAGGAARAAVVGLARRGALSIAVHARRLPQAEQLTSELHHAVGKTALTAAPMDTQRLRDSFSRADLVVQSTSATLKGSAAAESFAQSLPTEALPPSTTVVDLVYDPIETTVLYRARQRGLRTVDGLGMLLHQGAIAFERWLGVPAPIDAMRRGLLLSDPEQA